MFKHDVKDRKTCVNSNVAGDKSELWISSDDDEFVNVSHISLEKLLRI